MKLRYLLTLLHFLLIFNLVSASENDNDNARSFKVIKDAANYIKSEQESALKEDKLLLWVVGGNWCHDSRSLARKLNHPELAPMIKAHYRLSMVDVGYLDQGFDFTQVAKMSTFYATPTVLIIDPETMRQTNAEDMFLWSNAYQVKQEDAQEYFQRYSQIKSSKDIESLSDTQVQLKQSLDAYVQSQEQRILASYKILGPMLKAYKEGKSDPDFDPYWNALFDVRYSLQKTIQVNKQIITEWEQGKESKLDFPASNPLPWEKD